MHVQKMTWVSAYARIHVNDDVKKNAELVNASNGVSDYQDPLFSPLRDTEYNYEINYGFHVTNWLTVRPNLQYITHPGGVDEVDNALVARLENSVGVLTLLR